MNCFQDYSGKFLLPEVRTITVRKGGMQAIVNELIKGPMAEGRLSPHTAQGTILEKYELVQEIMIQMVLHFTFQGIPKSVFRRSRTSIP